MNNRIFFQHPDLMRLLSVHENVMTIMMNILTAQKGAEEHGEGEEGTINLKKISNQRPPSALAFLYLPS